MSWPILFGIGVALGLITSPKLGYGEAMIDEIGGALGAILGEYFDKKSFGLKKIFTLYFIAFYLTFFIYVSIDALFFSDDVGELKKEVLMIFGFSFAAGGVTSSLLTLLHFLSRWANNVNRDKS